MATTPNLIVISPKDILERAEKELPSQKYFAMYSSVLGGVVTNPAMMTVPLEDHLVHRGDGVFDVAMMTNGNIYQFEAHLRRSLESAKAIAIAPPFDRETLREIILQTVAISRQRDALVSWYISRGGGGLSVDPMESAHANFYVMVFKLTSYPEHFDEGMTAVTSPVVLRPPLSPQVKSCNYLLNAMVDLTAHIAGADSAIALDEDGFVAEGSNKNVGFITSRRVLKFPRFEKVLRGITATRAIGFAERLRHEGLITGCETGDIILHEAYNSLEMLLFSTTMVVKPVIKYDGRIIGDGKPGPVYRRLNELFQQDMMENREVLTAVPYSA